MDQLNFRAPADLHDAVDTYAAENDVDRSEAARVLLAQGIEHERGTSELDRIRDEHERERAELEKQRDRLQRELRASNARQDDVEDIVEYVDEERSLRRQRAEQERRRRQASIVKRSWWWLAGEPD